MEYWWELLSVFLLSTVKFVFGGLVMALGLKFSFLESVIVTTSGGFTGVFVFVELSEKLVSFINARKKKKKSANPDMPEKKKFTIRNKTIIKIKQRYGLLGFSIFAPFFIPIPLGCFLAVRYFNNKKRIIWYLSGSVLFWSVTVSSLHFLFKVI